MSTDFLNGGGAMGQLIRTMDWSSSPLGPPEDWPQSLKTAASLVLASKFAMVIAWGPEFCFLYNDRYVPVLGTTKHPAAMGTPAAAIFPEVWEDVIGPLFRKTTTGEAIAVDDMMIPLARNGFLEQCYFTLSYSPIREESGGVGGMLAVVAETTTRVQGERGLGTLRDLAARAAHAQTAVQAMQDAAAALADNATDVPFAICYLLEPDGTTATLVATAGDVGEELARTRWPFGAAIETVELEGRTAIVLPITRPGLAHPYGYVVAGTNPMRAFDDRYRGFFGLVAEHIATGVSNAKAYEQERQRAEQLAMIDRAKTAFFSNISHEFRTPLTLMLGPTEDALATPERCLRGEQLEAVYRNELRLLKLVNTLLDFARIEAGRIEACYRPTDVARLTADLASSFRSTIERAGLAFEVRCEPIDEPVWIDDTMWEKIVLNLLSNAFKFTFDGAVSVELTSDAAAVRLTVRDTGIGIAEEERARVFERFHRVQGAQSRTHEGSGIGLALVHELVRLHSGTITVESEPGRGSAFIVEIPRGTAHLPSEQLERRLESTKLVPAAFVQEARHWLPEEVPSESTGGPRILVVDDNADMREYLRGLLAPQFAVELASDGVAALAAVKARRPDLVVSDVMMPNLDGFGLLQELRRDPQRIPVILLSARAGEESRVEGILAGADDYVVKPFSARELLARVGTQLELAELRHRAERERHHAVSASRAKDEFLAMLGHELRNPLTPIQTALDLIASRPDAPFTREREIIRRQVNHMERLVDDLLDVSRIATGKVELVQQAVDLGQVVIRTLEIASPLFERHEHEVTTSIEPNLIVDADETRLAQILTNLITNAAKYTPRGGKLHIQAGREAGEITLRVRDNGVGIDPEMLPHVFDLFAQERQSIARSDGGLGLGLAIVRSLVALHGGTVRVASSGRGHGAEFVVQLPASARIAVAAAPAPPIVANTPRRRVLVVDDNVDAAELLAESLRRMGHDTLVAFDAPEAIRVAVDFKPEVALLDIGLPAMDGYELARHLVAQPSRPALLVAISGYGLEADRRKSEEAGFAVHLVKPVRVQTLRELLASR